MELLLIEFRTEEDPEQGKTLVYIRGFEQRNATEAELHIISAKPKYGCSMLTPNMVVAC